jgi:hypothetical protein
MRPVLLGCGSGEGDQLELVRAMKEHLVRMLKSLAGSSPINGLGVVVVNKGRCSFVECVQATGECFLDKTNLINALD